MYLVRSDAWKSRLLARDEYESSRYEEIRVPIHLVRLTLANKLPEDHDTYYLFEWRSSSACNSRPTCDSRKTRSHKSMSFSRTVCLLNEVADHPIANMYPSVYVVVCLLLLVRIVR